MYQPPHFREDDPATQHALIRAHPLGLLITAEADGAPVANLIPFHLDGAPGKGRLLGHMARANRQWQAIRDGARVLVVFQGEEAYISPSWYAAKAETGKVVPTWNYAVVQVRGPARAIEDRDWLRHQVGLITGEHEGKRAAPWAVEDAPPPFVEAQLKGIVGVEIAIAEIEGKWKVSQNRPEADIAGVTAGLEDAASAHNNPAMAALVRERGSKRQS
ncbi:FMN-binding negative transcriptional regulator [Nitratireductor mangrovi]|uniref:FMN-binding negative transcriptional regulator n=1 Tax=Nitratireductor mangrovi TaxID=2599600 RepID=A0A5B8KWN4_9HYPH|nr:FMN-binding negative transcriptional regulator [Nitratireductor mangrovi]QDZ00127.1 FMN-binding negative transcriptional regulator [Nitratireductor mangrovi]